LLDDEGRTIDPAVSLGRTDDAPAEEPEDDATIVSILKAILDRLDQLIVLEGGA
jgi:hypothetical protein